MRLLFLSKVFYYVSMLQHILSLTKQFISIRSDPGNTNALSRILELALRQCNGYTVERFICHGVRSALIYNTKKRPKKFRVILNTHLDVIPGKTHQYVPHVKGTRLYGVGAMDMKANAACAILAFKQIANTLNYPVAIQLTTDEETGGFDGTKYQIEKGVRSDFVLACEPTNFDIVNEAKGIVWLRITAHGKTAHGAYPWSGDNAIWKMHAFLDALRKHYPIPTTQKWSTTVNVSTMSTSNQVFNKIPDECIVGLDIRYVPADAKMIIKNVRALLQKGMALEVLQNEPALYTDPKNLFIQKLHNVAGDIVKKPITLRGAQGSSDARHFMSVGGVGAEFGPIGGGIGSDHEWVSIPSLKKYADILIAFLESCS